MPALAIVTASVTVKLPESWTESQRFKLCSALSSRLGVDGGMLGAGSSVSSDIYMSRGQRGTDSLDTHSWMNLGLRRFDKLGLEKDLGNCPLDFEGVYLAI